MWKATAVSVRGSDHVKAGKSCQDWSISVCGLNSSRNDVLLAVADGASSSEFGGLGAALACRSLTEYLAGLFKASPTSSIVSEQEVIAWHRQYLERIDEYAKQLESNRREFASTMLFAYVTEDSASVFQLGDGLIIAEDPDEAQQYGNFFTPEHGEYINSTTFLTQEDAETRWQHDGGKRYSRFYALVSDGLEPLCYVYSEGTVHSRFLTAMRRGFDAAPNCEEGRLALQSFISHPEIQRRTSDDASVALGVFCSNDDS